MNSEEVFNNLRQKLITLGYNQPLPLGAIPLVRALFEDLIKTTESLRDSKLQLSNLLEEKSCWELGVEPYKCDNSKLLAECNRLRLDLITVKEDYEQKIVVYNQKLRNLESDKRCLIDHSKEIEEQLKNAVLKYSDTKMVRTKTEGLQIAKKPFVTAVKTGTFVSNPTQETYNHNKCMKCSIATWKTPNSNNIGSSAVGQHSSEIEKLQNNLKDLSDQVTYQKKKIDSRDREIQRLNELLVGGRPPAALAKDCCYKNVGALSEDVEFLQREKTENFCKLREYQGNMHEAMQRALDLAERYKMLQKELVEFKEAALNIETQANIEIADREKEIANLKNEINVFKLKINDIERTNTKHTDEKKATKGLHEKRKLNEKINELIQKETGLINTNEKLQKKIEKTKLKLVACEKEKEDLLRICKRKNNQHFDEEHIRLKSERDFYQKEYLQMLSKATSQDQTPFLKSQLKAKDEEINRLRTEMCKNQQYQPTTSAGTSSLSARSDKSASNNCVQAIVLRTERERDVAQHENERMRAELDILRDKYQNATQLQLTESHRYQEKIETLNSKIMELEKENRNLSSARIPGQTQIILLKEELEVLKKSIFEMQSENCQLKATNNQMKTLQEQTERALMEYQNKYTISENHLKTAESKLHALDTNEYSSRNEIIDLKKEIAALKSTYIKIENEKDKLVSDLDTKTEKLNEIESYVKHLKEEKSRFERSTQDLQSQLEIYTAENRERSLALQETSSETASLRQQVCTLMSSREKAIAENTRVSMELADSKAEILTLKRHLTDSENEVERLKKQLKQYVQEVKKAEDLLAQKELERDEMLDHYRCLSHDAVVLEGNNQSLEIEAAEQKRQLSEAEEEIIALKQDIIAKNINITKLEEEISILKDTNSKLVKDIENAIEEKNTIKVDLDATKELCEKLDFQTDKLNAEVAELNKIRNKLERENAFMRKDGQYENKVNVESFQTLLSETRKELQEQIKSDCKLNQELILLKNENLALQKKIQGEQDRTAQQLALTKEYDLQVRELRHTLTDDRFQQAKSREDSPRNYPTL